MEMLRRGEWLCEQKAWKSLDAFKLQNRIGMVFAGWPDQIETQELHREAEELIHAKEFEAESRGCIQE
jgi:hypothetical protein